VVKVIGQSTKKFGVEVDSSKPNFAPCVHCRAYGMKTLKIAPVKSKYMYWLVIINIVI